MRKAQIDTVMAAMLDSHDLVSDLNLSVDRPLQVESAGELVPVKFTPPIENLTPFQTEIFALNLMHNDRRLSQMLLQQGSCDSSYFLPGKARFRVNIFSQRGNYSVVMRKLETLIPSIDDLKLRSEEHTSELQSRLHLVCRLLLEKKKNNLIFILYRL